MVHVPKESAYAPRTSGIFRTTDIYPACLYFTRPLLDRSNTPREATRLITLDRNYTNKRWLYNKASCDEFNPNQTKIEIKRCKDLRRIERRENKSKKLRETM